MKKIYSVPTCELLGSITTEILAGTMKLYLDDTLDDSFGGLGGQDTEGKDADANTGNWDKLDSKW